MSDTNDQVNLKEKAETTAKVDDFIQKAVNAGYEESMKRAKYKIQRYNERLNKIRKSRKLERINKRKGRK